MTVGWQSRAHTDLVFAAPGSWWTSFTLLFEAVPIRKNHAKWGMKKGSPFLVAEGTPKGPTLCVCVCVLSSFFLSRFFLLGERVVVWFQQTQVGSMSSNWKWTVGGHQDMLRFTSNAQRLF